MTAATEQLAQGSPEWLAARLGKITASRLKDVLTQPREKTAKAAGVMGKTAQSYMMDLVGEILTGESQDEIPYKELKWGNDHEHDARIVYSELTGKAVTEVGFITHPEFPEVGGSPDGLVGDDGGVEIKCPYKTRIHLGYLLGGVVPKEYEAQVNGHLWNTGRKWWDFASYDPRLEWPLTMLRVRTYRDETEMTRIHNAVVNFRDKLLETLCTIRGRTMV